MGMHTLERAGPATLAPWQMGQAILTDFEVIRPEYELSQADAAHWLAQAHARAEAARNAGDGAFDAAGFARRMERLVARFGCGPDRIARRGHALPDFGHTRWDDMRIFRPGRSPAGEPIEVRNAYFAEVVEAVLERFYPEAAEPPDEIIHVTCTGYVAPSGPQRLVARRGWSRRTSVTHAYHMGCYAAVPALRIAGGYVGAGARERVDIVHTELCTLHLDPASHAPEQLVIQSLFADGFVKYSASPAPRPGEAGPRGAGDGGLRVVALREELVPDSAHAMEWTPSSSGMRMRLAREVPDLIAADLAGFVRRLFDGAGLDLDEHRRAAAFAIHPGGPKIIDRVAATLALSEAQTRTSGEVLRDLGNMSSATLPHIWARMLADPALRPGTLVVSLAFGPGLTVAGALLEKVGRTQEGEEPCCPS